jgi:transcriptional regulator with XRE-family HTH domain
MPSDYTQPLQVLMQQAGFSSFRALCQAANISPKQLLHLRRGAIAQLRLEILQNLSRSLQVPLTELIAIFTDSEPPKSQIPNPELTALQQEYDRLSQQMAQQEAALRQSFQQSSLQILESLLLQLPTAAYAAQQNPQVPAVKLLPLLRPIDQLLMNWGIESIATVGSEIPYDPQQHQLMAGTAAPGLPVKVRYAGYRQGDRLLYRAKVSPI